MAIAFRRATHDVHNNYIEEKGSIPMPDTRVCPMHWMASSRSMTFDEIVAAMQGDRTNFNERGKVTDCFAASFPEADEIAVGLVRLIECGLAEVVIT